MFAQPSRASLLTPQAWEAVALDLMPWERLLYENDRLGNLAEVTPKLVTAAMAVMGYQPVARTPDEHSHVWANGSKRCGIEFSRGTPWDCLTSAYLEVAGTGDSITLSFGSFGTRTFHDGFDEQRYHRLLAAQAGGTVELPEKIPLRNKLRRGAWVYWYPAPAEPMWMTEAEYAAAVADLRTKL